MTPEYLEKRAVQIFLVSIFCVVAFIISGDIINKDYTIQDVYNWCCNKAECNTTLTISILIATRGQTMNKRDIKIFDNMICEAWNDSNAFCRKLKDYIGRNFNYVPELKKRCTDPYWENRTKQQ